MGAGTFPKTNHLQRLPRGSYFRTPPDVHFFVITRGHITGDHQCRTISENALYVKTKQVLRMGRGDN